jgi:nucleotide-binding universal stress UspA family protein
MKQPVILVAIDFSSTSFAVLAKALAFGEATGRDVHAVHVVERSFFHLKKELAATCDHGWLRLAAEFPKLNPEQFHCREGVVRDDLADLARALKAELVVLGSSGESFSFDAFIMGSYTKDIVRSSASPVLVLKHDHPLRYKNILLPTNLSPASKEAILKTAALFPDAHLKLYYVYVVPFESRLSIYGMDGNEVQGYQLQLQLEAEAAVKAFTADLGLPEERVSTVIRKGNLNPAVLVEEIEHEWVDLISIHTTGTFSFFAFDLVEASKLDILVYKTAASEPAER